MKFKRLIAVLPCESLEDFDLERNEADAEQLLSAWSTLWHPALLADQDDIPCWLPPSTPPAEPSECLIIIPACCETSLSAEWIAEAEASEGCILREKTRAEMLETALRRLGPDVPQIDDRLAADFLALGFCHFQVELLNRKSRYMSNLDESALRIAALDAARAAVEGNETDAREHLQAAFDRLHEAREYYHPLEIRFLDLTLLAPTTLGGEFLDILSTADTNLLVSGAVIDLMAADEPEKLASLKKSLEDGTVELIGGELDEAPLPLLSPEAACLSLSRGIEAYEKHLGQRPLIFGRRRFGLSPALPQLLHRLGFTAALHCTLDDGRFPVGSQSRIQWEGFSADTIDSLCSVPLDAARASSFLKLSEKLGDAMNLDQTPTLVFAHWPGRASHWYDDLRRIAAYSTVLGSFSSISSYFDQTDYAGHQERRKADEYRSPYLAQDAAAGRRDPLSRWVRYFERRAKFETHQALAVMETFVARKIEEGGEKREQGDVAVEIEDARDAETNDTSLDAKLTDMLGRTLVGFANSLGEAANSTERGTLVVNPCGFRQRVQNIEIPAMGFAWIGDSSPKVPAAEKKRRLLPRKKEPPLAEPNVVRNEFFEVRLDPATGALRSIWDYRSRGPRLAQQIALRLPHSRRADDEANYSIMAADRIEVTSAGPLLGEIVCSGQLTDRDGRCLAGFKQTTRARRGSRVLELLIDLDVDRHPEPDPWESYYAVRFAWKDETVNLYRCVNMANVPSELTRLESPLFVDLRHGKGRTTILCGGLPYHRRFGLRKMDSLLIAGDETARSFRLGIGIDVPHPLSAALGFISPPLELPDRRSPPSPVGWLFHLDCRNVQATHWGTNVAQPSSAVAESATNDSNKAHSRGRLCHTGGFRVRLLETDGRGVRVGLRCLRPISSARTVPIGDAPAQELSFADDRVEIPIGPHQWVEVEVQLQ